MANRHIICTDCGCAKWLSQKQWRGLVSKLGSPQWVKRKFKCSACTRLERDDPQTYYTNYGKHTKKMRSDIRAVYKTFLKNGDLKSLHKDIDKILYNNGIDLSKVNYIITPSGDHLVRLDIRGIPIIGNITISIYTPRDKTN
jgi:hypothetical protein